MAKPYFPSLTDPFKLETDLKADISDSENWLRTNEMNWLYSDCLANYWSLHALTLVSDRMPPAFIDWGKYRT